MVLVESEKAKDEGKVKNYDIKCMYHEIMTFAVKVKVLFKRKLITHVGTFSF